MKSSETGVLKKSDIYFSSPSVVAKKLYFHPISVGHFFCNKNYHLIRKNYESLLIAHIVDGTFTFVKNDKHITARKGDTVILDCYKSHEFYTNDGFELIWVYVSGANCLDLYKEIEKNEGNLIKCNDIDYIKNLMFRIFDEISSENPPTELNISLDIYKLFIELLNPMSIHSKGQNSYEEIIQD
ncbi:MAG: AraC family ligand binding domain-containing protein, partial [Oscillospiraceae bacterium]